MALNLEEYDLIPIERVSIISSPKEEILYDITLEEDHKFFVKLAGSDEVVLAHNCDGSHITSMLIGWFKRFAPELFTQGKICKLITPLILLKDAKGKITKWFFNTDEFKKWEKTNTKKCEILYMKGLGSWERSDLQSIIDKEGIESFIKELSLDDKSENTIEDWLGDNSEPRKVYLRDYIFDINQA